MKKLLSTTTLVLALGLPALSFAQTTPPPIVPKAQAQAAENSAFLSARGQSDVMASELIGHDVHARRTPATAAPAQDQNGMATMTRAELDDMDNIGQINEIVLSKDGQVRAIVIGVGGFLGAGEQDVAVTMDQVMIATDPEDPTEMFVIVNTGADLLKNSPKYERTQMQDDKAAAATDKTATQTTAAPVANAERPAFKGPEMEREGYNRVEMTEVSTELLVGKTVYGVDDASVGDINDLIVDDAGKIIDVIVDFGGFLGIGERHVSLGFDELTVLTNKDKSDVRVYIDATKEQIEALPEYKRAK